MKLFIIEQLECGNNQLISIITDDWNITMINRLNIKDLTSDKTDMNGVYSNWCSCNAAVIRWTHS